MGSVPILTRDDADHVVAVPARPLLARDERGRPKMSLTLVLSKRPSVDEPSITPLVTQGTLAFTATLALPNAATQLAEEAHKPVQPLFARAAEFSLRYEGAELQRSAGFGPGATAALSVTLDREAALSVLTAIRDASSGLSLECDVDYAVQDPPRQLHLRGSYSDIYQQLASAGRQPLDRAALEKALETMLYDGTLRAESEPSGVSISAITSAFLRVSSPVLQRVTAMDGERYSVRPPAPGQWLDVTLRFSGSGGRATLKLETGLDEMFRGCLEGQDSGAFIHLVAPDAVGTLAPMPRRVVQPPVRGVRAPRALGAASLARIGTSAVALSAAARPNAVTAVSAHTLLADTTVQPTRLDSAKIHHWALDNVVFSTAAGAAQPAERSLPVVDDAAAPLWTDRVDANLRWYAPQLMAETPTPNTSADASPFLFSFHTAGHTMSGAPGLEGRIRFRLTSQMSDQTRVAWEAAGKPNANPVKLDGLSVTLAIPFRDQAGVTRSQMFPATVTTEGANTVAEIALLDDWVRLAYGALSTPAFQSQPAMLSVAYTYEGYVPLNEDNLALLFERKQALTPVLRPQGPDTEPHLTDGLDARELTYRTPHEIIRFTREEDGPQSARAGGVLMARPHANLFAIRPELTHSTAIAEMVKRRRYGIQRLGRDASQTIVYPCTTLGALYIQEDTEAGPAAIGCRDAFKLGQTEYRQYLRLDELADPEFSVWRSLQQPGRFLLVPARWSIARFAADDADRAYRPSILVYSTLDAAVAENNRCAVLASLIPDISPAKRRALTRSLAALAEEPVVTLINEIDATLEYAWPLPSTTGVDARVAKLFDSFQVTLGTGIDFMPQLQAMLQTSGVIGTARYQLPDGSTIESALVLDLNRIVGPAPDGPLEVTREGSIVRLTNRIERAVDVSDLIVEAAEGRIETVRVDRRLDAGTSLEVAVPADAVHPTPVVVMAAGDAATLSEIRSFVEDIHTNVAFVNLINYANHGLAALSLQARLRDVAGTQTIELQESAPVSAVDFVLPLTTYLANPVLEFAVTRSMTDGTAATTAWQAWPLVDRGNVVSLTWDLIS
jgi:hypothetical protein